MPRARIVNAEIDGYSAVALDRLRDVAEVACHGDLDRDGLIALLKADPADVLIVRLGFHLDRAFFEELGPDRCPRAIATATTGLNHVDLDAARQRGIAVLSLKGELEFLRTVTATAEHTWGLLLALIRHLPEAVADTREGNWRRDLFRGIDLSGRTLGIVGLGRIGTIVARYADAFGMTVLAAEPKLEQGWTEDQRVEIMPLEPLLRASDIITLHVDYSAATHGLIGTAAFDAMKPGALLVNTSRGAVIDQTALLDSLESGKLGGAALDVIAEEDDSKDEAKRHSPLIAYAREHPNLLITPHIGGATMDSMHKTEIFMAGKIATWLSENGSVER